MRLNSFLSLFIFVALTLFSGFNNYSIGQDLQNLEQAEDSLVAITAMIHISPNDSIKEKLNSSFYNTLLKTLALQGSVDYPFQALKSLVKITSPDNKFTIYHWNLPDNKGNQRYFGLIRMGDHDSANILPLTDISRSLPSPDSASLDNFHWFGALYYEIILNQTSLGEPFYTLLGWAGKNTAVTQKIIEILTFNLQEIPHFGLAVFPDYDNGKMKRIIFRYSATTTMSLKYEDQAIVNDKKWNPKKRAFEYKTRQAKMIVCDRLVPLDPQLEGQYQFYVAAGDVFDGFEFKNGWWSYIKDIDSRNKK